MTEKPLTSITVGDQATIAALATPPGRSAVAMIRISGPDARQIGTRLIAPMPETERHVQRSEIRNTNGQLLDDALVWYFEEPNSYTGEDVLEVTVHGGMIVPGAVLRAFIEAGARLAEPGEFTRRAVLNGKLDVLQAEAVGDLIDARSSAAHHQGLRQLGGALSDDLEMLRSRLLEVEAMLAYDIDFPEEDDGPIPRERVLAAGEALLHDLGRLLATSQRAEMIRDGALVVLAGAPNVGKSSLFNAMLGEVRAIVTDIAGTTRDAIEAVLDLPNIPLRLVDTAGLHETQDPIEVLGIETTSRYLEQATVILACVTPETATHTVGVLGKHATSPIVVVGMKGDLVSKGYESAPDVIVSATTRNGLSALLAQVEHVLQEQHGVETGSTPALTRARHRVLVGEAELEVQQFLSFWRAGALPAPVAATHIHTAATALGELLGVIHVDDVLDVVFRSFCVGK